MNPIREIAKAIPEELQLGVGDFLWDNQLRLARLAMGAERKTVPVNGVNTAYIELGDPDLPAFIFIPGFSDRKESYLLLAKLLSDRFHCIVVDVPGFGESGKLSGEYTIEYYSEWLIEFIETLHVSRFHFYGNSLGGAIIGELAYRKPESILSLVFSCSAGIYVDGEESFYREYSDGKNLFRIESEEEMEELFGRLFYKKPWVPFCVFQYLYLDYKRNKHHYSLIMDNLTKKFLWEEEYKKVPERYSSLNHKTLVIWGRHDSFFPVALGEKTASHIPGAEFRIIENCGHLPHLEKPWELKNEIIRFLD